jgi:hypothetical protein
LQATLDIAVARLQVLRRQEGAFGPDNRLKLAHGSRLKLAGGVRESQKGFHGHFWQEVRPPHLAARRFSKHRPNAGFSEFFGPFNAAMKALLLV